MLIICAYILKKEGRLKNDLLVSTIMSNLGLRIACKKYGFQHHASNIGDRYVLADMLRLGAILGGEDAGHMIFLEHHKTGDGIIAAMQLIAAMLKEGKPLNIDVKTKPEISEIPSVMKIIRQVEKELGEEGRVLVRYSGTQNMCRIMVEGPSHDVTEKYCREIADVVKNEIGRT
jgi:phosphoglucosamine mutase